MFEQERVYARLQQRIQREPSLQLSFLAGSYGRRAEDAYADLDLVLGYEGEAARRRAWDGRRDFVRSVLPYVRARSYDVAGAIPYRHRCLYSNGTQVDFLFLIADEIRPAAAWREIRVLQAEPGWEETFIAGSARAEPVAPVIDAATLAALDEQFWVQFWDVYRQLWRADSERPFPAFLALVAHHLPRLMALLPPGDPARAGLAQVQFGSDNAANRTALKQLLAAYEAARAAIVARFRLAYSPDRAFEAEIHRHLDRS